MPYDAPPKFAASRYYSSLKESVGKSDACKVTEGNHNDVARCSPDLQQTVASSSSGASILDMILSGQSYKASTTATEALVHRSALSILQHSEEGSKCRFQGVLVVCDIVPRDVQYTEGSPRKRKNTTAEGKAVDIILVDKTAPISACLWGEAAEEICSVWRQVQQRRQQGEVVACVVDLSKVRIQGAANNNWNGESLTRMRALTSIESVNGEEGTTVKALLQATADNLTQMTFAVPSPDCCVSVFRTLRNRLTAPFRMTVRGKIADLQTLEMSQGGNAKRIFDIVDNSGLYFTCCAMKHNAESTALQNVQEVVIYYGTGRGPIGTSKGMFYLMKDAMILSIGAPTLLSAGKTEELAITS